jgi:hypothetical protein
VHELEQHAVGGTAVPVPRCARLTLNRPLAEKAALGRRPDEFVPTPEYLRLTADFHSPAFLAQWGGVSAFKASAAAPQAAAS